MKRKYRGLFGKTAKRRCPHDSVEGIFGPMVERVGGWRLQCNDCGRYLDGPVQLAQYR